MFKQIKSAFIWFYIYKFRRTIVCLLLFLFMVLFSQDIYEDVVSYLTLTHQLHLLKYALLLKWGIILTSLIWGMCHLFKLIKKSPSSSSLSVTPLNPTEQHLMHKKKLMSRADYLIEKKRQEKEKQQS